MNLSAKIAKKTVRKEKKCIFAVYTIYKSNNNMEYTNLKDKTIFDFTRDKKILKKILTEGSYLDYIENPDETIEESKDWQERYKIGVLVDFAKITKNKELYNALKREFGEIYYNKFRKVGDPIA
jgi:tRNA U34 5-carboxymethylaminomethyl modifying enzyme MnmG/GidA